MSHPKNKPTPWTAVVNDLALRDANDHLIAHVSTGTPGKSADQLRGRLALCVNACEELDDPSTLLSLIEWCRTKIADGEESIGCRSVLDELGVELGVEVDDHELEEVGPTVYVARVQQQTGRVWCAFTADGQTRVTSKGSRRNALDELGGKTGAIWAHVVRYKGVMSPAEFAMTLADHLHGTLGGG